MPGITTFKSREIIDDFAKEIEIRKLPGATPSKAIINFRNWENNNIEQPVYMVPIELLRYRKDNGRISSDVLNYEKSHGILNETTKEAQETIQNFLENKDPEKTEELTLSIQHAGQRDEAIITCDGFLINGNRRKMVLERLFNKTKDRKFQSMKVVILPGKNEIGGAPTLLEIEQIENRCQLQSDGKAEYYNFDKALSIKRKIDLGMSLSQQLKDDPQYAHLSEKDLKKVEDKFQNEYLKPLECIEQYLSILNREKLYSSISTGYSDREGRWQAFLDYSKSVYKILQDPRKCVEYGIHENERGKIEDICFKIIRKRDLKGLSKPHDIMRDIPKYIQKKDSKKELLKLSEISLKLSPEESIDDKGNEHDARTIDLIWGAKYEREIINQVKKAINLYEHKVEKEAPLKLLQDALDKLKHDDLIIENILPQDLKQSRDLVVAIEKRATAIERELYHYQKKVADNLAKIKNKFN